MWRWPVVQARKNAVNSQKGKVFSLHAKLISIAATKWWNPEDNPTLAAAIAKAKKEGVPNDNIDRAIKKGTGEDSDGSQILEIVYEGYAPGGVALLVSTVTDNKNRTVANIRHIFSKYGGNMWESGAVSWMFHKKWIIFIDINTYSHEEVEMAVLESGAEDMQEGEWYIKVISSLEDYHNVESKLSEAGYEFIESKISYTYDNEIEITEFEKALKFYKMLEAFDNDEDVNFISSNEYIAPKLEKEALEYIEKNTFRT